MFLWVFCQGLLQWLGLDADINISCAALSTWVGNSVSVLSWGDSSPELCCAPIPAATGQVHLCWRYMKVILWFQLHPSCVEQPKLFSCIKDPDLTKGVLSMEIGVVTRNSFDFVLLDNFPSLLLPIFRLGGVRLYGAAVGWSEECVQILQAEARCEHPSSGNKCSNFAVQGTSSSEWLGVVALMISSDTVSRLTNWLSSERSLKRIVDKSIWIYNWKATEVQFTTLLGSLRMSFYHIIWQLLLPPDWGCRK